MNSLPAPGPPKTKITVTSLLSNATCSFEVGTAEVVESVVVEPVEEEWVPAPDESEENACLILSTTAMLSRLGLCFMYRIKESHGSRSKLAVHDDRLLVPDVARFTV
jgi:hypothetical protein